MKTQNMFLKRMVLASMVVAFVVNNVQAMDTDTNSFQVALVEIRLPEGPARQKYNNFERRYEPVELWLKKIGKAGLVVFLASGAAAAAGALVGNKDAINVGALISGTGLMAAFALASTGICLDDYAEKLHEKAIAEEKKAWQAYLIN